MNPELRKLLNSINAKKQEVKDLVAAKNLEGAENAKKELVNMQKEFDILYDLEDQATKDIENGGGEPLKDKDGVEDSVKEFAAAARVGFKVENQMSSGSAANGGYTVPEDIQTRINQYRDSEFSLLTLVAKENVTTDKGSRTYQTRSNQTGFGKVDEDGNIPIKDTPTFARESFAIDNYGGFFPVTNQLLADSDQNITGTIIRWIGGESRATANTLILQAINTKNKVDLQNIDGIKKVLNITLGQAFKSTSKIITNDNGLHYLDTLKDADGKYLLTANPSDPMKLQLSAGATVIPVVVIPNKVLANDGTKIPFIIGDLVEGVKYWDRQQTSIVASTEASIANGSSGMLSAFGQNMTLFRAIEREDVTVRDPQAFVNGYINVVEAAYLDSNFDEEAGETVKAKAKTK